MKKLNLFGFFISTALISLSLNQAEADENSNLQRSRTKTDGTYRETGRTGAVTGSTQTRTITESSTPGTYTITGTSPQGFSYTRNVKVTPSGKGFILEGEGITMDGPQGNMVYTITPISSSEGNTTFSIQTSEGQSKQVTVSQDASQREVVDAAIGELNS